MNLVDMDSKELAYLHAAILIEEAKRKNKDTIKVTGKNIYKHPEMVRKHLDFQVAYKKFEGNGSYPDHVEYKILDGYE